MTSLRRSQRLTSLMMIGAVGMTFMLGGCGDDPPRKPAAKASGGSNSAGASNASSPASGGASVAPSNGGASVGTTTPSDGGANPSGGTQAASGGASAASGGETAAETGGTPSAAGGDTSVAGEGGSTSAGAAGATSASTGPVFGAAGAGTLVSCESDLTCKDYKLVCNMGLKHCATCWKNADCTDKSKSTCDATGTCVAPATGCKTNADCAASTSGKACDTTRGRCVPCVAATDCANPAKSECVNQACVSFEPCTNTLDCKTATAPVCSRDDVTPTRCVQCAVDADCEALAPGAGQICVGSQCRAACGTAGECQGSLKCSTSVTPNYCAECATNADCSADKFCSKGACIADICKTGDQACISGGVAACKADGDGFGTPEACPAEKACMVINSRAGCGGVPNDCSISPGTIKPCDSLPQYFATQTVDGKGEDFCAVPSFELSFANAAGVNNNKATGGSTADYKQKAVARVAWSAQYFHAFVEVTGMPVRSNTSVDRPWDGDSIELMVTTGDGSKKTTNDDPNALHLILNYGVGVTVKSDGTSGWHTAIPAGQFKGLQTSTGYAVEVKIPWPGGATVAADSKVRFDMAMNVDTESVDPTVQGRDAQAVLVMTTVSGTSSCSATPATPFCDERIWCATALK